MISCNCEGCELKTLFFENVSTSEIEAICGRRTEHEYKRGETIIREGDLITDFIYLQKGLVKLSRKDEHGGEQIQEFTIVFLDCQPGTLPLRLEVSATAQLFIEDRTFAPDNLNLSRDRSNSTRSSSRSSTARSRLRPTAWSFTQPA